MHSLFQDIRYGLRVLIKAPGFSVIAMLTLALGIGANSTIFSWMNSTLLNPIPGAQRTQNVVTLTKSGLAEGSNPLSYLDYVDLRDRNHSFSGLTAFDINSMSLTGIGKPERIWGSIASANYFDVLEVRPALGRGFLPAEDLKPGGAAVAVISYRLWQTHFAADPAIIGRTIGVNLHPFTIVGVAPPIFQGVQTGLRVELWIPLMMAPQIHPAGDLLNKRESAWLMLTGRLKPGVARLQAQQDANVLMQQIARDFPDSHVGSNHITVHPLWSAPFTANFYFSRLLPILLVISGVVLLLACANVANLLLVRSVTRRREMAIRLSIGATRTRLVVQLLVESILLSLGGGAAAAFLTVWTAGSLNQLIPPSNIPIWMNIQADRTVFLVTLGASLLTGLIFGILPALRSTKLAPVAVLKEEAGSASGGVYKARLSSALVVAQISLSLLLLVSAVLCVRSFQNAQRFNPGFNEDHVLLATYDLRAVAYSEADALAFSRRLLAELDAVPGVQAASLANWVPLGFTWSSTVVKVDGYVPQPHESMEIGDADVSPDYFRTMQIPVITGREFVLQDTEKSQPVVVVNKAFADGYWPQQAALGKRVYVGDKSYSVVGVVANSNYNDLKEAPRPFLYFSSFQNYSPGAIIHARVSGDPLASFSAVEKAIHELNADLPVFDVSTLSARVQVASTGERIAGVFVGAFGVLALILSAVGIYGVIAYTTRQRTHEIGIRMALGACEGDVFRLVLGQGLRLTIFGLTIGIASALAFTRFLDRLLFGIAATDPLTFAGVATVLGVVALLGCYFPARRATRVDPMIALRYE